MNRTNILFETPVNAGVTGVGLMAESSIKAYRIWLTPKGNAIRSVNGSLVESFPAKSSVARDVEAAFVELRDDMATYITAPSNDLWWSLKDRARKF